MNHTHTHKRAERGIHKRLEKGQALMGLLQLRPNPALVEIAGQCGLDFIFIDCEHGVFSDRDHLETLRGLAATDVLAMVRLNGHDELALRRYVDMGADAIVVPHVSTAEEALNLVSAMRGSQKGVCLFPIIESELGVTNASAIFAISGVDGAFVGPNDLTADLGFRGDYARPEYADALSRVEKAASASGKVLGTAPHAGHPVESLFVRGHRLFVLGTDVSVLREALCAQVAQSRSALSQIEGKQV